MSALRVRPGDPLSGVAIVPGDKSIAQRLLVLGAIATGDCEIEGVPASGDVLATLGCLAGLRPNLGPELQAWNSNPGVRPEQGGFTSDGARPRPRLRVPGGGRRGLGIPDRSLDCGNSGTAMRLLMGLLAAGRGSATLTGDASLSRRPMERVAQPLRAMGAQVITTDGHAPVTVTGGRLSGMRIEPETPSAQVKGAILLAGLAAAGETEVIEPVRTRDHTERILHALGVIAAAEPRVRAAEVPAFLAEVPGDISGAAFLAVAALASGGAVRVEGVGLNPTRLGFAELLRRMGAEVRAGEERACLGEPIGALEVRASGGLRGVDVSAEEVVGAIDEIPAIALLCALADGPSRFRSVGELRVKESDRIAAIVRAIRGLGGEAEADGADLLVGGGGLRGGTVDPAGDHRIAMASAAAGLGSREGVEVRDAGCASVSFPGFATVLDSLGADVEG